MIHIKPAERGPLLDAIDRALADARAAGLTDHVDAFANLRVRVNSLVKAESAWDEQQRSIRIEDELENAYWRMDAVRARKVVGERDCFKRAVRGLLAVLGEPNTEPKPKEAGMKLSDRIDKLLRDIHGEAFPDRLMMTGAEVHAREVDLVEKFWMATNDDRAATKDISTGAQSHINLLGLTAKDKVTGFTGVISSISFDLYGCIQVALSPPVDKEGKLVDGRWFDVHRLDAFSSNKAMPTPVFGTAPPSFGATPAAHTHGPESSRPEPK